MVSSSRFENRGPWNFEKLDQTWVIWRYLWGMDSGQIFLDSVHCGLRYGPIKFLALFLGQKPICPHFSAHGRWLKPIIFSKIVYPRGLWKKVEKSLKVHLSGPLWPKITFSRPIFGPKLRHVPTVEFLKFFAWKQGYTSSSSY